MATYKTKQHLYVRHRPSEVLRGPRSPHPQLAAASSTVNGREIDDYFGLEDPEGSSFVSPWSPPAPSARSMWKPPSRAAAFPVRPAPSVMASPVPSSSSMRAIVPAQGRRSPTRDPRMKERKKYGLKAARRAPQFSKR